MANGVRWFSCVLVWVLGVFCMGAVAHAVSIDTNINADTVWDSTDGYTIANPITINYGATLTVAAGTHIRLAPGAYIRVQNSGTIRILGTIGNPVVISGSDDNVNIQFFDGSTGAISYADISHNLTCLNPSGTVSLVIDHSTFHDCGVDLSIVGGATLTLLSNTFADDVFVDLRADVTHSGNTITRGWHMSGDLSRDLTLSGGDGTYVLSQLLIPEDKTLTLGSGTTVRIANSDPGDIRAGGSLIAQGTAASPVTIQWATTNCAAHDTAIRFRTGSKISLSYTTVRDMCGSLLGEGTTALLDHAILEHISALAIDMRTASQVTVHDTTLHDVYSGISVSGSTLTISDSTFSQINGTSAIATTDSVFDMTHVEITGAPLGLLLDNPSAVQVTNNSFHDNTVAVRIMNKDGVDIRNNWWGKNTGPKIDTNANGTGDALELVHATDPLYTPWLRRDPFHSRTPVLIVPGIMGTQLMKDYEDRTEIWPDLVGLIVSQNDRFLDQLILNHDGGSNQSLPLALGDIIRSSPGVDIFNGFISSLTSNGYSEGVDLFVFPYDWRYSNTVNQERLRDKIDSILRLTGSRNVDIVAHSMGGILAKEYIAKNGNAKINKLIFVGTPHIGAPKAFKALMYGDDMGINKYFYHILSPDRVKIMSQNMPSAYELLPSKKYFELNGAYVHDFDKDHALDFDQTKDLMVGDGRNSLMLSNAQQLHDHIDDLDLSGVQTYNFSGCSTKTISSFRLTNQWHLNILGHSFGGGFRLFYGSPGDETVPLMSSSYGTYSHQYYVNTGTHAQLPSLPAVRDAITALLNDQAPQESQTLSSTSAYCTSSGKELEIHSPVTLDIYDDFGNHTGPKPDGTIEYGIPGVQYDVVGEEKFAFLPDGQHYHIVNHAQAIGSYDFYIDTIDASGKVTETTYFNEIPITTMQTVAYTDIGSTTGGYTIHIDQRGEGETTIAPTSVLSGEQARDTTPPTTQSSMSANTATLSATDDASGVLRTIYSIDGGEWHIYEAPFAVEPGATIAFASIDKAGNAETPQTTTNSHGAGPAPVAMPIIESTPIIVPKTPIVEPILPTLLTPTPTIVTAPLALPQKVFRVHTKTPLKKKPAIVPSNPTLAPAAPPKHESIWSKIGSFIKRLF